MRRRTLLKLAGAAGLGLSGCATTPAMNPVGTPDRARVLVVGGGYGGATAAKYLRLLIDAGFLDHVKEFTGSQRLFPEIEKGKDGYHSHNLSKFTGVRSC